MQIIRDSTFNSASILFLVFLLSSNFKQEAYALDTIQDTVVIECSVIKPEYHSLYYFVDSTYHKNLQLLHIEICKKVYEGRYDLDRAKKIMDSVVQRCAICRDDSIYQGFKEFLKALDMPSVVLAFQKYCQDTFDPNGYMRMKNKGLIECDKWLDIEFFCQFTHEIAYPSGFWENLLEPDLKCIRRFQQQTDLICDKIRDGVITLNEANYRWQQAYIEFEKRLGPETLKEIGKNLQKPIKVLIDMLK